MRAAGAVLNRCRFINYAYQSALLALLCDNWFGAYHSRRDILPLLARESEVIEMKLVCVRPPKFLRGVLRAFMTKK